jgi:sulfide:quinone oxidoreductase
VKARVLILGAGFGGLELSTQLSEAFGDDAGVILIDKSDSFIFGYSKLDVMFGRTTLHEVQLPYKNFAKPGVRLLKETVTAIDAERRRVSTDGGEYEADFLVLALGVGYDLAATPHLAEAGNEFYSPDGAVRLREILPTFSKGRVIIGTCAAPFKCPPAPSEAALLLHEYLTARGVRGNCEIDVVLPFGTPIPPSPEASHAILEAFAERDINFVATRRVAALEPRRKVVVLDDGSERPYDLFLGVPKHCAPAAVQASGMAENGWVPVNPRTLETRFPGVYAIGDIANTGAPKAGVFAEDAARTVAMSVISQLRGGTKSGIYNGIGTCYIEFGGDRIGRVDMDFLSGPKPTGKFQAPSAELRADKERFGLSRRSRWFGL